MKKHTRIYLNYYGYGIDDIINCEVCNYKAVDIHHIDYKGMGGSKDKDKIENLIALCRSCHNKAHNKIYTKYFLKNVHNEYLKTL